MTRLVVIFDGKCSFCIRSLRPFQSLDRRRDLLFVDANDPNGVRPYLGTLGQADLSEAMFVIDERGVLFRGFFAFRRIIWNSGWTRLLVPLFYAPLASFFGTRIYAWVAKNRYRFGCASGQCSLPEAARLTGDPAR